jgi:hypothetical protein
VTVNDAAADNADRHTPSDQDPNRDPAEHREQDDWMTRVFGPDYDEVYDPLEGLSPAETMQYSEVYHHLGGSGVDPTARREDGTFNEGRVLDRWVLSINQLVRVNFVVWDERRYQAEQGQPVEDLYLWPGPRLRLVTQFDICHPCHDALPKEGDELYMYGLPTEPGPWEENPWTYADTVLRPRKVSTARRLQLLYSAARVSAAEADRGADFDPRKIRAQLKWMDWEWAKNPNPKHERDRPSTARFDLTAKKSRGRPKGAR